MNIIELEPARVHSLNIWWLKPEALDLVTSLENSAKKATHEYAELQVKATAEGSNPAYEAAAKEKLLEAAKITCAIEVLKSFFPDGPFIARIEL